LRYRQPFSILSVKYKVTNILNMLIGLTGVEKTSQTIPPGNNPFFAAIRRSVRVRTPPHGLDHVRSMG